MENVWITIAYQLSAVQSSKDEVPHILNDQIGVLLDKLVFRLHTACRNIDRVTGNTGKMKALKFALFLKGSLEKDISGLEKWRDMFSSTLYMLSIPKDPTSDRILSMEVRNNAPPISSTIANVEAIRDVNTYDTGLYHIITPAHAPASSARPYPPPPSTDG